MTTRRSFLAGLGGCILAAPAIVRAASLMPVKSAPEAIMVMDLGGPDVTAIYPHELMVQQQAIMRAFYIGHMLREPRYPTAIEIEERIRCHLRSVS